MGGRRGRSLMTGIMYPQDPLILADRIASRIHPKRSQFDYIILKDLSTTIARYAEKIYGTVLDYGCGLKPYVELFYRVKEYIGADFSNNPRADIHFDDMGRIPYTAGNCDTVVSFQVLEHVPDVDVYLSECRRLLQRNKGMLLLTTHGIWEYHPGPGDFLRWTHEGLIYTINRFGFRQCAIEPITTGIRSLFQIVLTRVERKATLSRKYKIFLYRGVNVLADRLKRSQKNEERFYDFPICYLYLGKLEL